MIEDDFDRMVRWMFESFLSRSGGLSEEGSITIRSNLERIGVPSTSTNLGNAGPALNVEKIDLGDTCVFVVENASTSQAPLIRAVGRELIVEFGTEQGEKMKLELPYAIDVDKSSFSYRNGIIEINLLRAVDDGSSSDTNERYLKSV
ncbi:MAG: Hsp20/alpha crystallin family protein [Candidatus Thorarchaeota archaeon]